jgi:peptidoglycan/LPS O-acetylase OafA/YrhL
VSEDQAEHSPGRSPSVRPRLHRTGWIILAAGMIAAVAVYCGTSPAAADADAAANSASYNYQMEMIGGKANLLAAEFREWFAGRWHGRPLAATLAVLAAAGWAGCFLFADYLSYVPPEDGAGRRGR